MDLFDIRLLGALQGNSRLTSAELADTVGLSPSQCARRRAALEADGIIAACPAILDAGRLGLALTAFVEVTLDAHSAERSRRFASLIDRLDAVQEAYSLTGQTDYLLKLAVPDLAALAHILNDVLLAHESVARVHSSIVLTRIKATTSLPLDHLR